MYTFGLNDIVVCTVRRHPNTRAPFAVAALCRYCALPCFQLSFYFTSTSPIIIKSWLQYYKHPLQPLKDPVLPARYVFEALLLISLLMSIDPLHSPLQRRLTAQLPLLSTACTRPWASQPIYLSLACRISPS